MIYKTISIKSIISSIYRDLDLQSESKFSSLVEWIAEALEHIGIGSNYTKKEAILEIKDFKCALPCDFISIIQVGLTSNNHKGCIYQYLIASTHSEIITNHRYYVYKNSYTINNAYINVDFREGFIKLIYEAMLTDEEGFPLVPDDVSYRTALVWYCMKKLELPEARQSKDWRSYDKMDTEWLYYCSQARGQSRKLTLDQMESIKNQMLSLIPRLTSHAVGFINLNKPEHGNF
jgi:hypothetical protein